MLGSNSASIAMLLGDWLKELISNVCRRGNWFAGGRGGCLVTAFDLISYFSVAALFGWFTFTHLTEIDLKNVPKSRRKIAENNVYRINQLFIMSFLFFAIAALADYLLHHLTISSGVQLIFQYDGVLIVVLLTFITGMGLLVAPIGYVQATGRSGKHLGSFELPPFFYMLWLLLMTTASSLLMLTSITFSTTLFYITSVSGIVPYFGLYLALRYWKPRGKKTFVGLLLIFWPAFFFVGILVLSLASRHA